MVTCSMASASDCMCPLLPTTKKDSVSNNTLIASNKPACKALGLELAALALINQKQWDDAEKNLLEAKAIWIDLDCNKEKVLSLYKLLDNIYINKGNFEKALDVELVILPMLERKMDTSSIARSLLNIANIFFTIKQYEKGIEYTRRSIPVIYSLKPSSEKVILLTRAAQRYYSYFEKNRQAVFLDTMSKVVLDAKQLLETIPYDKKAQFIVYTRLATIAIERKEYTKAIEYIDLNLSNCDRSIDIPELAVNYSDKAEIMFQLQQYTAAMRWADSSMLYTKRIGSPPHLANLYHLIYQIAEKMGDAGKALRAFQEEKKITDSLNHAAKISAIEELEEKYNQSKNEQTIKELAQEKKIFLLLSVVGLLGLILIGFFLRQQSLKHKQTVLLTEQRLNRARMNPHFFFNTLASLQHIALQNNSGMSIASQLAKFSFIMRETLESTYKDFISIDDEITFLNAFLSLQQSRFTQAFQYELTTDPDLDTSDVVLPSMILQPFIENSIEHGFHELSYPGKIEVHFKPMDKYLLVSITDNGQGFQEHKKESNTHISRATQIIQDRLYLLNLKFKTKASFELTNAATGIGITVNMQLPLLYKSDIK